MLAMVVGENRGIECRTRFLKTCAILREKELKTQVFEGYPEKELARGNWNDLGTKGEGRLSIVTAVYLEAKTLLLIMGQVEVMEKEGVVIGCDSRHLLETLRVEGNLGSCGCPVLGQPSSQHGLFEVGLEGLPSMQP